jgi:hypothetical protein
MCQWHKDAPHGHIFKNLNEKSCSALFCLPGYVEKMDLKNKGSNSQIIKILQLPNSCLCAKQHQVTTDAQSCPNHTVVQTARSKVNFMYQISTD